MFDRIKYYWDMSEETISWAVAYRRCNENTILSDRETPFAVIRSRKGTWAADPFFVEYEGKIYLFEELYLESKRKGVLACSELTEYGISDPVIVIEEKWHLSFPCVFKKEDAYYMIPESGSQGKIYLYKATDFPYKWQREKVLLADGVPSDTIVFEMDGKYYLLASMLKDSASVAENRLYLFDGNFNLKFIKTLPYEGEVGARNGGLLFQENGIFYRVGQNCEGRCYGKGLVFWKIEENCENIYRETEIQKLELSDISIEGKGTYCGIHTYNRCSKYDIIDLKIITRTSLIKRIRLMLHTVYDYFFNR